MSKKVIDVWGELADSSDEAADLRARAFYLRAIQAAFRDATMPSVSRMKPADAAQYEDLKRGRLDLFSRERLADIALSIYGVEALSTLVREELPTQAWRAADFVPLELSPVPTTKVEAGFCVFEGKHHPTVTLTLPSCHLDDNEAWNNRDSIATWLTTQIANNKAKPTVTAEPPFVHTLETLIRQEAKLRWPNVKFCAPMLKVDADRYKRFIGGADEFNHRELLAIAAKMDFLKEVPDYLRNPSTSMVQQSEQSPVWDDFENLCRELMRWLAHNQHPHTHIIITANSAELSEGVRAINTNEYLVD